MRTHSRWVGSLLALLSATALSSAQDAGLRGTQTTPLLEPDNPYSELQQLNQNTLQRRVTPPPQLTERYQPITPSASEEIQEEQNRQQQINDPNAPNDPNGLQQPGPQRTALRPARRPITLAPDPETDPATDPRTVGTVIPDVDPNVEIGPDGRPLPRGAVVTPDGRVLTGVEADRFRTARARAAQPADPLSGDQLEREEDPFEAPGIRSGSLILRPTLEQGLEYSSERADTTTGTGQNQTIQSQRNNTLTSITTLGLNIESDWREGSLEGDGFLRWRETLDGEDASEPEADLNLRLTQPITRDWQWSGEVRYGVTREDAIDTLLDETNDDTEDTRTLSRAREQTYGGALTVSRIDGRLRPTVTLDLERQTYSNSRDEAGEIVDQSVRDQTTLRGTTRLGYQVSPAFLPYLEAEYANIWRDNATDASEFRGTVGAEWNPSDKLNGSFGLGWAVLESDDTSVPNVDGIVVDGALNWSPSRGTLLTATLATELEAATNEGENGSISYQGTLALSRQMSRRFSVTGTLGFEQLEARGTDRQDRTWSADLAGTYWLSRYYGLTARARHEQLKSSQPGRDSETTTLSLGLRLQR